MNGRVTRNVQDLGLGDTLNKLLSESQGYDDAQKDLAIILSTQPDHPYTKKHNAEQATQELLAEVLDSEYIWRDIEVAKKRELETDQLIQTQKEQAQKSTKAFEENLARYYEQVNHVQVLSKAVPTVDQPTFVKLAFDVAQLASAEKKLEIIWQKQNELEQTWRNEQKENSQKILAYMEKQQIVLSDGTEISFKLSEENQKLMLEQTVTANPMRIIDSSPHLKEHLELQEKEFEKRMQETEGRQPTMEEKIQFQQNQVDQLNIPAKTEHIDMLRRVAEYMNHFREMHNGQHLLKVWQEDLNEQYKLGSAPKLTPTRAVERMIRTGFLEEGIDIKEGAQKLLHRFLFLNQQEQFFGAEYVKNFNQVQEDISGLYIKNDAITEMLNSKREMYGAYSPSTVERPAPRPGSSY